MKKIWLMGGFGNVLFQILAYKALRKNGLEVVYVDYLTKSNLITKIGKWTIHQNLYGELVRDDEICFNGKFYNYLAILFGVLSKITRIKFSFSSFYKGDMDKRSNISTNVFGYFQEKEFLDRNKDLVSDLGERLNLLYSDNIDGYDVVVHYRKGDSVWANEHYYKKILSRLKTESNVVVVTDSLNDAKLFFKDIENCNIVRSENAIDDFRILISANKLYCAPSTFSWWAAHGLSENSSVLVPELFEESLGMYVKCNYEII